MQPQLVLTKTMKGIAELEQRSLGLSQVMRRVLIMLDGRRSVAVLMHENAGALDVVATIEHLLALGLVTPLGGATSTPAAVSAHATPSQALVHMAEALLGSAADKVTQKLQAARDDPTELKLAVDACVRLIRLTIDEGKASDFRRQADVIVARTSA